MFLLPFLALGGASTGSPVLIARLLAKAGRILFSPFTMAKKSVQRCFRASPSILACSISNRAPRARAGEMICERLAGRTVAAPVVDIGYEFVQRSTARPSIPLRCADIEQRQFSGSMHT